MNILKTKTLLVLGPTTYSGVVGPIPQICYGISMFKELLGHTYSTCQQCSPTNQTKAEWLCCTWGFTARQKMDIHSWYNAWRIPSPPNNRLLFLTSTLSSCSHKGQLSHISCGFLACLSTVAKFKACYHSPADTEIHGTTRKIKCPNNDKDLTNLQKQKSWGWKAVGPFPQSTKYTSCVRSQPPWEGKAKGLLLLF